MAELIFAWVIAVTVLIFAAALAATLAAASLGLWLDLLDQLAARRKRRGRPRHPHSPMPGPTTPKPPLYGYQPRPSCGTPNPPPLEP
jgi:hypothetical protein